MMYDTARESLPDALRVSPGEKALIYAVITVFMLLTASFVVVATICTQPHAGARTIEVAK